MSQKRPVRENPQFQCNFKSRLLLGVQTRPIWDKIETHEQAKITLSGAIEHPLRVHILGKYHVMVAMVNDTVAYLARWTLNPSRCSSLLSITAPDEGALSKQGIHVSTEEEWER
jgi:hypothetical protein